MHIHRLSLTNFKSHGSSTYPCEARMVCLTGRNGVGKTNVLDAIHYLCLTKSYFNTLDQHCISFGQEYGRIESSYTLQEQTHEISCKFPLGKRKDLALDGVSYKRMSDHIGLMPVVMIAPDTQMLILGGSEERRRFTDTMISQIDHEYLEHLILYQKHLDQRNALLRHINQTQARDETLLTHYDSQIIHFGTLIHQKRKAVIIELVSLFQHYHPLIVQGGEKVRIDYQSDLSTGVFADLLVQNRAKDIATERTHAGTHRDDILFYLSDQRIKKFGSQGQQKSLLMAIKLAEWDFIKKRKGFAPILLIDDIFDKLDEQRSGRLMEILNTPTMGQVFITHTDEHSLKAIKPDSAVWTFHHL